MTAHPPIAPLPAGVARPFWSVMIPTYEPEPEFLRRTIAAVLEQDPGPAEMQIAVVDDASTRVDPRPCIPDAARQRVEWVRQERHLGIGGNWNACIARARGQWVHLLHQDDLVRPGFYAALRAGIDRCPQAGAAFCRDVVVDGEGRELGIQRPLRAEPGILEDWLENVFVSLHVRCPAIVVRRAVYEAIGGFRVDLHYALDWDMWKRIAVAYPLWYTTAPLATYRRHHANTTLAFQRSGANMAEIERSIGLSESVLPPAIAAETTRRARERYARYAAGIAWQALTRRDLPTAWVQLRAARAMSSTRLVAAELRRCAWRALRPGP
jgi:glycosyltransferase involved in cell wall biosynthesis